VKKPYDVARIDELEALPVDEEGLVWRPVRRRFGIESFGLNAYTAAKAGDRVVEEHTETTNGHEECYFVAAGSARFTLDGDEIEAPTGTFVAVAPQTRRGAIANEAGTTIVAIGGKPGAAFTVSGWESSFAAFAYQRAGDPERALATLRAGYKEDDWAANYNLACLLALQGHTDEALEKLTRAVAQNDEAARLASGDDDFASVRDDPRFASAVAGQVPAGGESA
jgi:quercetin dioxygenase-like cupin family protein